jgi:hypothetical protein
VNNKQPSRSFEQLDEQEKANLKDFLASEGWKIFKKILEARQQHLVSALLTAKDHDDVIRFQSEWLALDKIQRLITQHSASAEEEISEDDEFELDWS